VWHFGPRGKLSHTSFCAIIGGVVSVTAAPLPPNLLLVPDELRALRCSLHLTLVDKPLELGFPGEDGGLCHFMPTLRISLHEIGHLLHRTQAQFAHEVRVIEHEIHHRLLLCLGESIRGQHSASNDLLDAQQFVPCGSNLQIQVVATGHDCVQVRCNARTLGNRAFEVDIRKEQNAGLEVELVRNVLRQQDTGLLVPIDASLLTAVQCGFEQVQHFFIEEHAVTVVEYQHSTSLSIVIKLLEEPDRRNAATNRFIFGLFTCHRSEQVRSRELLFNPIRLADARGTRYHQPPDHALCSRVRDFVEHQEGVLDSIHCLIVGFGRDERLFVVGADRQWLPRFRIVIQDNVCTKRLAFCVEQLEVGLVQLDTNGVGLFPGNQSVHIGDGKFALACPDLTKVLDEDKETGNFLTTMVAARDFDLNQTCSPFVCRSRYYAADHTRGQALLRLIWIPSS
jgi:hypothetical protein